MIELLIASLLFQEEPSAPVEQCEAIVDRLEVRRAVRTGEPESIIEAADLVGECRGRVQLLVTATQLAWEEENLEAVSVLAPSALRLVSDQRCAWVPLAAELAFAAGFAQRAVRERGSSFYFYVADLIDARTNSLPRSWHWIADEFGEDFGTHPPDDIFAFDSPYIDRPYRTDEELCGDLPRFHIRFDSVVTDSAFAVMDIRTDRNGNIRGLRSILSYPGEVPPETLDTLSDRQLRATYTDEYLFVRLTPCTQPWFLAHEEPSVCLPIADIENKTADSLRD